MRLHVGTTVISSHFSPGKRNRYTLQICGLVDNPTLKGDHGGTRKTHQTNNGGLANTDSEVETAILNGRKGKLSATWRYLVDSPSQRTCSRIKDQPSRSIISGPPSSRTPIMGCSEEVSTDAPCLQTRSVSYPLVGPLYRFASAAVCAVVCSRRKSIPRRLPIPPQSSPPTPSRIHSPPPDGDPPQQPHFNLAQQLRPALAQITSWLEDDDVQIIGGLPISAGGFTDLWKGSVDSRLVAIKSYRRYLSFDLALVFLVCVPGGVL